MRFPKIADVARELRALNAEADGELDVRLQVYEDGQWAVRFGDSGYDQDHHGYWGSGSVPGNGRRFSATDEARRLINEAKDHAYEERTYGGEPPTTIPQENPMEMPSASFWKSPAGIGTAVVTSAILIGGVVLIAKEKSAAAAPALPPGPAPSPTVAVTPQWITSPSPLSAAPAVGSYVVLDDARTSPPTRVLAVVDNVSAQGVIAGHATNYWLGGAVQPGINVQAMSPGAVVYFTVPEITFVSDSLANPIGATAAA